MPWVGATEDRPFPSLGWVLLDWWADYLPSPRDPAAELIFTDEQALQLIGGTACIRLLVIGCTGVAIRAGRRVGVSRRSRRRRRSAEFRGPVRFAGWDANNEACR